MHNFKKILPRAILLVVFVILLERGVRFLYEPYTQYSVYANKEYKELKGTVDTIFCGSSKTYSAYDPIAYDEAMGTVSFNFGTGSQPLESAYDILEDTFRVNPVKTVYLEVSLSTLQAGSSDAARIGANDRVTTLRGKLASLIREEKSGVQVRKLFYSTRVSDYFDFASVKENVQYKLSDQKDTAPVMPDNQPQYISRGFITTENKFSGVRHSKYPDRNTDKHCWLPELNSQENVDLLKKTIELCQKKGAEVILVSSPIPEIILAYAGDMNDMHAFYQDIADQYGAKFYDMNFYRDKSTFFPNEAFRDVVHLNHTGAETLTALVAELYQSGDDYQSYFTEEYEGKVAGAS